MSQIHTTAKRRKTDLLKLVTYVTQISDIIKIPKVNTTGLHRDIFVFFILSDPFKQKPSSSRAVFALYFLGGEFVGTIRVHTANERIIFDNKPIITSGNKNINDISVTFCDKWLSLGENTEYWAVFYKDEKEIHKRKLENGSCLIPNEVLTKKGWFYFGFYSEEENGEKVKTSKIAEFEVTQGVPTEDTGENEIDIAVNSAKEEYRSELETALETATGENYDGKTWEELNNTVAELPIISDEQTQALGDWDLIKSYFADYTGAWHDLFRNAPTDDTGANREYRLPYIYTPKMAWAERNCYISTNLLELGVDVSSAVNLGGGTSKNTFQPLPKLQKLTLTGNANSPSLQCFMYKNSALQYLKMDTPSEEVLKANSEYYDTAFHSCSSLVTIDCELDFTGQTSTYRMFDNCYKLKDLRIKPFTLSTSLDLGDCRSLHNNDKGNYDSLISILNAITLDREVAKNITITFSNEITDFTTGMEQFWTKTVYFYASDGLYHSEPPKVTEDDVYLELTLYEAFTNKGVTIAWV